MSAPAPVSRRQLDDVTAVWILTGATLGAAAAIWVGVWLSS